MDVAALGISVDTKDLKSAKNEFAQFTNAARVAERAASGLSDSTGKFSSVEIAAMASAMGTVEKTSNAAAKALAAASLAAQRAGSVGTSGVKALGQSAGVARQQVQNLAFQFQDIATMMAMGQSPFMLLAQQLPQVTMYGGQLNGVMGALKATLVGFISPLGLITTGFVLLGTAAISYFSEWFSRGSEANMTLAEQSALIQKVANDWGDAAPRMKAYADEMERAAKLKELLTATEGAAQAQYLPIQDSLSAINEQYTAAVRSLRGYGDETNSVVQQLTKTFTDLQSKIMDNKASTDDLREAQNAVNIAVDQYGTPAVMALAAAFGQLAPQIDAATQSAAGFRAEASVMPSLGQLSPLFSEGGKIFSGEDFAHTDPPTPSRRPLIELEGLPKVGGGGRTKTAKQSGYDTATASLAEQTRALQAQTAAQATLNPLVSDYGYAVAKAKVETDLLLAAEKDKRAITPELTAQINAQAESYAQAVVEQNKLTEATKKATEAVNFVKNTTAGFINDLRDGLKNGESFWESFSNAALNVLDRITDKLLNDVMDAIFKVSNAGSSSGGGLLSGLFGGLFGGTQWGGIKSGKITGGLFADGGYTGNASAKAVAGVVHGGEYVFSKKATDRLGVGNLEAMHRSAKGYAVGGFVGSAATSMPANNNVQEGGQTVVLVQLSPDLEAKILQQAAGQTVKIVGQNEKNKQNLQQNGQAQNG